MIQLKIVAPGDTEKTLFRIFNNEASNAFSRGELVQYVSGSTADGIKCVRLADNTSPLCAGVVDDVSIAAQKYGYVQVSGIHDAVFTATTATVKVVMASTVQSSIGRAVAHSVSTQTAADANAGIIGSVLKVTDTNTSMLLLRML